MTENQIKALRTQFNGLNTFQKCVLNQPQTRNKDVVEEIRLNIESEIDRLISIEGGIENDNPTAK